MGKASPESSHPTSSTEDMSSVRFRGFSKCYNYNVRWWQYPLHPLCIVPRWVNTNVIIELNTKLVNLLYLIFVCKSFVVSDCLNYLRHRYLTWWYSKGCTAELPLRSFHHQLCPWGEYLIIHKLRSNLYIWMFHVVSFQMCWSTEPKQWKMHIVLLWKMNRWHLLRFKPLHIHKHVKMIRILDCT